jgi:hypothetical protein
MAHPARWVAILGRRVDHPPLERGRQAPGVCQGDQGLDRGPRSPRSARGAQRHRPGRAGGSCRRPGAATHRQLCAAAARRLDGLARNARARRPNAGGRGGRWAWGTSSSV